MKLVLFYLISLSFILTIGCRDKNVESQKTNYIIKDDYHPLEIVIVDNCEYLFGDWGNATVLTHKGDCKNCKNTTSIK